MKGAKENGQMKRSRWRQRSFWIILSGACFFIISIPHVSSQETRTKIRISYPTASIASLALFAAQQCKVFEQNGLEVESILMRSQAANAASAAAVAGRASGEELKARIDVVDGEWKNPPWG